MKKRTSILLLFSLLTLTPVNGVAQRIQQTLGRGVVVAKNGNNALVTWRKLAQESEKTHYNVYVNGTKINNEPLTKSNIKISSSIVPVGSKVSVTTINGNIESAQSKAYTIGEYDVRNMFMSIRFDDSPLMAANYNTAYVWPADLDGDGEMDYIVNRKNNDNALDCYIEAYMNNGVHLWTVKLGPNELSCAGQDDMILAYDMDCDGKADVVMQTSDGTQFWDNEKREFGLYVNKGKTGDTDGDGIIDYETQSKKNAPRYMTVVDGLTGKEKHTVEQTYNSAYNRTNRQSLMGDEYNKHVGHMGVFYNDGVHPAVIMEWHTRYSDGSHTYYNSAFAYDFTTGEAGEWKEIFCKPTGGPAFHQIRIADVDGDGCDEMQTGGYTMDNDGETLNNAGISHGDRFRTSDIDPERPGLETFAIQQDAGDMLGQILYDAETGKAIKKWYLPAVGDVGRGECMDVDPNYHGWEMWSTMGGVYNAQGNLIPEHTAPYPTEGIWWDGELDREIVQSSDSHYNVYIQDFYKGRLIEIAKLSNWRYVTVYAKRAAFWGDIIGDWREELILLHKENGVCVGIVGFTTDYATDIDNIYCLQEDPAYRGQCTTKGYYQSPNTGFYLGFNMPRPQLPPCMITDLRWKSTNTFTDYKHSVTTTYTDGKSVLLDLNTDKELTINEDMAPSIMYAMPVKNQVITINGNGKLSGDMELWKSQAGRLIINNPTTYTGKTVISQGTLEINGEILGLTDLRARGTLAGNAIVNDIIHESALNYEGARLSPGTTNTEIENEYDTENKTIGIITFKKGLTIENRMFLEMDIESEEKTDILRVVGDLKVNAPTIFTINYNGGKLDAGKYKLITYSGAFEGDIHNFDVHGLTGLSYNIINEENAIWLVVNEQRTASTGVQWTGNESHLWDYQSKNFLLNDAATEFVANDEVEFTDDATITTITMNNLMPVQNALFKNSEKEYIINGNGGFSGNGSLVINGGGNVRLNVTKSDYTGATIINNGVVTITELADAGTPSSIGAANASSDNWHMGKATLIINNSNTSTNRGLTLNDTTTIVVNNGSTSLKGIIKGAGTLIKKGAGQLNLNANNDFSGGIILENGTLAQGAWNATLCATNASLIVKNGTVRIFDQNSTSTIPNFKYNVTVPKNGKMTLEAGQRCHINGSFSGEGNITLTIPYVRTDMMADWSNFKGNLTVSGNQFRLCKSIDMKETTLTLKDGINMGHFKSGSGNAQSLTSYIGALASTGNPTISNGIYNVGYNNKNSTFTGTISCNINKYGTGNLTLTGTENTGILTIHEGAVIANNNSGTIAGTINVMNGGSLYGKGFVKTVSLKHGSKLMAGQTTYLNGILTINGTLTSESGATVLMNISKTTNDKIHFGGAAIFGKDTLEITVTNRTITEGEEFQIFEIDKTFKHDFIVKGIPSEGLIWDITDLGTTGIIRAMKADGIHENIKKQIKIYPQIVSDRCTIDASHVNSKHIDIKLTDTYGRILETIPSNANKANILNMKHYPSGVYLIHIHSEGKTFVTRIIKVG